MTLSSYLEETALPVLFRDGMRVAQTEQQKDMLLLSLITAAGYALPKTFVRHGLPAHKYYPNLMTVVLAPPASGKGIMNLSRRLLQPIHDEKRRLTQEAAMAAALAGSDEPVPEQMAMLPANASCNAFLHLLNDNDGRAIMIETEMDVLSGTWRRDYGNYSAAFRQAFEHETISKARKLKGELLTEVNNPQLSVLLSGTPAQLYPLLVSRENGLASRLLCYTVDQIVPFREEAILKHGEKRADEGEAIFSRLSDELYAIYHWLNDQERECEWRLTDAQADEMRGRFLDGCRLLEEQMQLPLSFDSVIKRLPVTLLRIGMILSMVRYWEEHVQPHLGEKTLPEVPAELVCSDADFEVLMSFMSVLVYHAMTVHALLPGEDDLLRAASADESESAPDALLASLPKQFGRKEAVIEGEKMGLGSRAVEKRLKNWEDEKLILRISRGHYCKTEN